MSWAECDWEPLRFSREEERRARKEHRCEECAARILPGETYVYGCGKTADGFFEYKQHLLCRDACVWIRDVLEGECIPFGGLREWWLDEGKGWIPGERRWDGTKSASRALWLIGARMYAMVRRRERLSSSNSRRAA